ncbi:MAG: hypothetical protein HUU49_00005, partial [Candidatus Buchananbacteria bacterium]|nr:hypothetical protein [Candidatus Buchananbacteria bacterium]
VANPATPPQEPNNPTPDLVIIYGCTDQTATNYNQTATDDDGTCEYQETEEEIVQEEVIEPEPEPVVVEEENPVGGEEL